VKKEVPDPQEGNERLNRPFLAIVREEGFGKTISVESFLKKSDVWSLNPSVWLADSSKYLVDRESKKRYWLIRLLPTRGKRRVSHEAEA